MSSYDYIICGAGAAGLSLAVRMQAMPELNILVIDKDEKTQNDRTWCYWSKKAEYFDAIVSKRWSKLNFDSSNFQKTLDIHPYSYSMIRGIDFYKHCLAILESSPNTNFVKASVDEIIEVNDHVRVNAGEKTFRAKQVFKSFPNPSIDFSKHQFVIQHFMGWEISLESNGFDEEMATFMDFSISQDGETRFMYVLPSSDRHALVELAIFSNSLPEEAFYESIIKTYIEEKLTLKNYKITGKEKGSIPMTNYPFAKHDSERIINIGTAAGVVKPSSGFAFQRIQEHSDELIKCIQAGVNPGKAQALFKKRYKLYDSTLLNAILTGKTTGEKVFTNLFKQIPAGLIFKFLDEKTSIIEDTKVFTAPPTLPFLKGFIQELL